MKQGHFFRRRGWIPWAVCLFLFPPNLAEESAQDKASEYLEQVWQSTGAPGLSAAVAMEGEVVFSDARGFADLGSRIPAAGTTVYNIGSISKVLAAVAVMQLVERGDVLLDVPIQRFVSGFPEKGETVSVRHLMTHTSGIRHYSAADEEQHMEWNNTGSSVSFADAISIFKDDALLFEPGAYYRYSSYAVNLLQGVIESASGMGFEDYMQRHVWRPAGMVATRFDVPRRIVAGRARSYVIEEGEPLNYYPDENVTYKFAGGGMLSTVEDLIRFGVALNHGGLMKPETLELMFTPQLEGVLIYQGDAPAEPLRWQQAIMWRIRTDDQGREFLHHCGTVKGYNACLVIYRNEDLIIATADNAEAVGFFAALGLADFFRPVPAKP